MDIYPKSLIRFFLRTLHFFYTSNCMRDTVNAFYFLYQKKPINLANSVKSFRTRLDACPSDQLQVLTHSPTTSNLVRATYPAN